MTKFTKFIRNIPWKDVLVIVLVATIGIGAIVGIGAALTTKTKTVSSLKFERGAIDSTGAFIESDTSIYTADFIECQGLRIEPDFDATGTYQVFYYDANKKFAGATELMNISEKPVYEKGNTFAFATYCKIVLTPETPKDDDGYLVEDYKIKFYEVTGIANKFTITVNKEQKAFSIKFVDGLENKGVLLGKGLMGNDGIFEPTEDTIYYFFDDIDVSNYNFLILKVKTESVGVAMGNHYGPVIFNHSTMDVLSDGISYVTLGNEGDFTYILCNVANVSNVIGFVDSDSSDCFEIYLSK